MILGKIIGKTTTLKFNFAVNKEQNPGKFDYIQVYHADHGYVLCQIVELLRDADATLAKCNVIGYRDEKGIKRIRTPLAPGSEVLDSQEEFIRQVIELKQDNTGYIGKLEGKDVRVCLDLNKLLSKHCSILAKSGSGKSYTVGVLVEEIMEKGIPVIVIDPHGEYSKLKFPNNSEKNKITAFGISPKAYDICQYGFAELSDDLIPLKLKEGLSCTELVHLLPMKLSNSQTALLYAAINELDQFDFDSILLELSVMNNNAKFNIINAIKYLKNTGLFGLNYTPYENLVRPGQCTIINLKGVEPTIQEIIVHKLMKDLFHERKLSRIPPFFTVLEEAHNFCPERSFGEAKSSAIIRTIASEGRKFGQGLCIISQRPARVDKSVLSQATTQIILKMTNPQDIRAVASSAEGLSAEAENEISNLPIGTALVCGVVDMPLLVNVRPRRSMHGGDAVLSLDEKETQSKDDLAPKPKIGNIGPETLRGPDRANKIVMRKGEDKSYVPYQWEDKKSGSSDSSLDLGESSHPVIQNNKAGASLLPVIKPKFSKHDLRLCNTGVKSITTYLIPAVMFNCMSGSESMNILLDLIRGEVLMDIQESRSVALSSLSSISPEHYSYEKVDYFTVEYDVLLEKKLSVLDLQEKLSALVKVTGSKECFIVYNKIE